MSLLQMSFAGGGMILAATTIRALTIHRLPKRTFLALWGVALLRLLVPFSLPSTFSAYTLVERGLPAASVAETAARAGFLPVAASNQMRVLPEVPTAPAPAISPWLLAWGIGALACALFFAVAYFRCRREFRASLPVENAFVEGWLAVHRGRRRIRVRQFSQISAPLTYGALRPVILLPQSTDWTNTGALEYVLAHEYVHIRRLDAAKKLALVAALCVHWFNPCVWLMYILANRDIELSCDEAVVRLFGARSKSTYARVLIGMEEARGRLTPLCNNFSKNAIEERIIAIMKTRRTSRIAMCVAIALVLGISATFATSARASRDGLRAVPGISLTDADYEMLSALQPDGYEDMTVSAFQNHIWAQTDTPAYQDLLNRLEADERLYEMKDSHETAAFLFNVLEPLTAEKWQTRGFGGCAATDYAESDNALLEYSFEMTILDPGALTVREYNDARLGILDGMAAILRELSLDELQLDQTDALRPRVDSLARECGGDALQISIDFVYRPLMNLAAGGAPAAIEEEPRDYGYATAEDYAALLTLKTPGYRDLSVAEFNAAVLDWGNEHPDAWDRIQEDVAREDSRVELNDEDRSFVALTVMRLSGGENFRRIQSLHTGQPEADPWLGAFDLSKETSVDGYAAWCTLFAQFSYHIDDPERLTVGARDRRLGGFLGAVQRFWDETSLDELLKLTERDVVAKFTNLAEEHSGDGIAILIDENQIHFEHMDERDRAEEER